MEKLDENVRQMLQIISDLPPSKPTCWNTDMLPGKGDGLGNFDSTARRDWKRGEPDVCRMKEKFQPASLQLMRHTYYIRISSLKHITLWFLTDLFAQGNVNLHISTATPYDSSNPRHALFIYTGTVFCWRESPWTCVQGFCTDVCLRGITRCGRTLFSHVICLVCLVSALQFSYEFHREREGGEKRERRALVAECSSSGGGTGCLDRWKANYWMGFLAVCWEKQRTDGIYRQQIKLLDWRHPFLHNEQ